MFLGEAATIGATPATQNAANTTATEVVNNHNATPTGGASYTNGIVGDAFYFNGNGCFTAPDGPEFRFSTNSFTIEFRGANGSLVDVGSVHTSANMAMPGMVMSGGVEVSGTTVPGRYQATADFGMAGAWKMRILFRAGVRCSN